MAISDIYTIDSAPVTVAATTQTAIVEMRTASTLRAFVVGIRVKIGVTAAAAGNSSLFTLARSTAIATGGTASTPKAHDSAAPTAVTTGFIGSWTIAPTVGTVLAEWMLPQTTGSMWEEFPPLGYEWVAPVSGSTVLWVTNSVATSTPVECQIIFSE